MPTKKNLVFRNHNINLSTFIDGRNDIRYMDQDLAKFTRFAEITYLHNNGLRKVCDYLGTCSFSGERKASGARVLPTVSCGPKEQCKYQYYRLTHNLRYMPLVQKQLNQLADRANNYVQVSIKPYDKLLIQSRPPNRLKKIPTGTALLSFLHPGVN